MTSCRGLGPPSDNGRSRRPCHDSSTPDPRRACSGFRRRHLRRRCLGAVGLEGRQRPPRVLEHPAAAERQARADRAPAGSDVRGRRAPAPLPTAKPRSRRPRPPPRMPPRRTPSATPNSASASRSARTANARRRKSSRRPRRRPSSASGRAVTCEPSKTECASRARTRPATGNTSTTRSAPPRWIACARRSANSAARSLQRRPERRRLTSARTRRASFGSTVSGR